MSYVLNSNLLTYLHFTYTVNYAHQPSTVPTF